jgi:hypothetical protein
MRNVDKILIGKFEGKKTLGRPRCGRGDNIRMGLRETGWAFVNTVMNVRVP